VEKSQHSGNKTAKTLIRKTTKAYFKDLQGEQALTINQKKGPV
jgi:hypothetical protein